MSDICCNIELEFEYMDISVKINGQIIESEHFTSFDGPYISDWIKKRIELADEVIVEHKWKNQELVRTVARNSNIAKA